MNFQAIMYILFSGLNEGEHLSNTQWLKMLFKDYMFDKNAHIHYAQVTLWIQGKRPVSSNIVDY